ncbi:MAG: hypothetical protein PSN37_05380 [Alphaproteobacteria bacterium]|nr:hypothetical protein [Alphaproteobacteria bacterium]
MCFRFCEPTLFSERLLIFSGKGTDFEPVPAFYPVLIYDSAGIDC